MENLSNLPPSGSTQKHIRGWLSFFLFVVGCGSVFTLVMIIANSYPGSDGDFYSYLAFGIDIFFSIALVALACYTIYSFLHFRPNAVFLGRLYILVIFISNLLNLISGDLDDTGLNSLPQVVKGLVWSLIWLFYLSLSNQVAELFPKEKRVVFIRDKFIASTLMAIPALLFCVFLYTYLGNADDSYVVSSAEGEYSDGVVAFRVPESLLCETVDSIAENAYVSFESGDSIWGTVMGVYDTNTTEAYFEECVDSWRDTTLDGFDFSASDVNTGLVNHNMLRMQSVQYITDPRIVWTFAALYSPDTGKACIVSCYTTVPVNKTEGLVNDMLHTVRFK